MSDTSITYGLHILKLILELSYDFSNGNASRYQQDNRDLDESDMRAMGYIDMTLGGPGGTLVPPHKVGSFKNP